MAYEPRTYRQTVDPEDLVCFRVAVKETDLLICAGENLSDAAGDLIAQARWEIEDFIRQQPRFAEAFAPFAVPDSAPPLVRAMSNAAAKARVGPMAAVAGVIAEYVAKGLAERSPEVIVENGGDIYICGTRDRTIALSAGASPLSERVGLVVRGGLMPVAVCTSSGTVGHSTSFGAADAVTVLARDGALADAVATALANRVRDCSEIDRAIEAARQLTGVLGVVVVVAGSIAAWGNVRLVPLGGEKPTAEAG